MSIAMNRDQIKMSVIISSRERPEKLSAVIKNLIQNSENCRLIEFLIAIDDDDHETKAECDNLILNHDKAIIRYFIFQRKTYERVQLYVDELVTKHARGELLLFWGDDIYMKPTNGWDSIIYEEYFKKHFGTYFIPCHHVNSNWKEFLTTNRIDTSCGPWAMPYEFYKKIGISPGLWWDTWVESIAKEAGCYYVVRELSSNHDRSCDRLGEQSANIRKKTTSKTAFHSEANIKERSRCANIIKNHIAALK
jgi:hypothetical protein